MELAEIIKQSTVAAVIVIAAVLLIALLSRSLKLLQARANLSSQAMLPIRLLARYGVIAVAVLLILSSFGIPINNFWTLVSTVLGLVAIGFVAVWSILSNISSAFLILLFKPFRVGDYVELVGDDVHGEVVDLSVMFTTLRGDDGEEFAIPNNQFFQKTTLRRHGPPLRSREDSGDHEKHEAHNPDHSMANLEGIQFPDHGRSGK